ncbi:hypothetical protein, partial [Vibrio anguillarum]|uniref:hypothetical protein n=1 Tax=Vibrio anguillarum TaxID=55601 RepID=UPI001BE4AEF4
MKNDKRLIECDGSLKNKATLNYLKARHSSIHSSTSLSSQAIALYPKLNSSVLPFLLLLLTSKMSWGSRRFRPHEISSDAKKDGYALSLCATRLKP